MMTLGPVPDVVGMVEVVLGPLVPESLEPAHHGLGS
jgi:hypothetical protein